MDEQIGSQTVSTPEPQEAQKAAVDDWRSALGLPSDTATKEPEKEQETPSEVKTETPAIEPPKAEQKGLTVKFNKEDVEIPEDKVSEYVQKGLALDKERERKTELEKSLDRAAKLNGFKDQGDYIANLPRLEQEAKQREENQFTELRNQLRDEAWTAGLDPDHVDAWLNNHPLMKQAQMAIQERETAQQEQAQHVAKEQVASQWGELYTAYPALAETSKVFDEGGTPEWFTTEMKSMVDSGYQPLHAYKLANLDKLQTQTKKQTEQQVIKQQQLGTRATVETNTPADDTPEVPDSVKSAFSLFGLDPRKAAKHFKK